MGDLQQVFCREGFNRLDHDIQRLDASMHEERLGQSRQHMAAVFVAQGDLAQQLLLRFCSCRTPNFVWRILSTSRRTRSDTRLWNRTSVP